MPSKKPSTPRGTAFRQRVKNEGGRVLPAVALDKDDWQALEKIRDHLEQARGRDVPVAEVVRYVLRIKYFDLCHK